MALDQAFSTTITDIVQELDHTGNVEILMISPGIKSDAQMVKFLLEVDSLPLHQLALQNYGSFLTDTICPPANLTFDENWETIYSLTKLPWRSKNKNLVSWFRPNTIEDLMLMINLTKT